MIILAGWLFARFLSVPLIYAYHTHVPEYLPRSVAGGCSSDNCNE